ncbi:hypothetical protein ScPMuIL_015242 [Solemya velum]
MNPGGIGWHRAPLRKRTVQTTGAVYAHVTNSLSTDRYYPISVCRQIGTTPYLRAHSTWNSSNYPVVKSLADHVVPETVTPETVTPETSAIQLRQINKSQPCKEFLESVEDRELLFGLGQQYFLEDNRGDLAGWLANLRHLKFKVIQDDSMCDFYGGVGLTPTAAIEREIAEVHSRACFYAGIKFAGLNREDAPGQVIFL